jgi:hypothetical protein
MSIAAPFRALTMALAPLRRHKPSVASENRNAGSARIFDPFS